MKEAAVGVGVVAGTAEVGIAAGVGVDNNSVMETVRVIALDRIHLHRVGYHLNCRFQLISRPR